MAAPARIAGGGPSRRTLIALVLFAIGFAYVESAVVVYLRMIYEPLRATYHPESPDGELFPVLTLEQLKAEGGVHAQCLWVELGREFSTLVILAAVAAMCARTIGQWFACFMIAFGVWDIFFYVWLKACIDWPASIFQWDILFLLPRLWAGPVLTPVLVSLAMILAGAIILVREARGCPYQPPWWSWTGIVVGAVIIILAFCWDWRHLQAGNLPRAFPWGLFAIGHAVGFGAFLAGLGWRRANSAITPV
ncbi:MAG: hypothetical protein JXA69_17605 [Phycisphaerae bacterium]|nr:hypothetical protein [Phycisphaerae bacterium]